MTPKLEGMAPLLQVFDMPASVRFYRDVLGFQIVAQAPEGDDFDWCLLRRDGIELMLNTAYEAPSRPPAPDPGRAAAHGDVTLFIGCADLDAAWRDLRALGIAVAAPVVAPYGMRQLSLSDPDGYAICLQWPAAG
ncbi:MAG: VOC family protein [Acidobacteriota bacterium]